jgi:hypothetical protein
VEPTGLPSSLACWGERNVFYQLSGRGTRSHVEFPQEGARHNKIKVNDMLDAIDRRFVAKPRLATLLAAGLMVVLGMALDVEEMCAAGIVLALLVCASFVRKALRARSSSH